MPRSNLMYQITLSADNAIPIPSEENQYVLHLYILHKAVLSAQPPLMGLQ